MIDANIYSKLMAYEDGDSEFSDDDMIELFQDLVDSGLAWSLQGHYGRTAMALIRAGVITPPKDRLYPGIEPTPIEEMET